MKLIVIVIAVVVALFIVVVVVGAEEPANGPRAADSSGFVDNLSELLIGPADEITPRELEGQCVSGRILTIAAACVVQVDPSDVPVRELSLEVVAGSANISFSQPDQIDVPGRDVAENEKRTFSVFKAGGTIVIRCSGLSCALELANPDAA